MLLKNTLKINKTDGSLTIKNFPIVIKKDLTKEDASKILTPIYRSTIDYKNGKEWLFFEEIEFSECPCNLGLYFVDGLLKQIRISITPPDVNRTQGGWSSDESINQAVLLTLIELRIQLAKPFKEGKEIFEWGEIWCIPDLKRSEMDAGIKYT